MNKSVLDTKEDSKLNQLKAILYLLQTNLEEFKDEVDSSYELLKLGKKTDLSKKIEQRIDNPINDLFEFSSKIDNQVSAIIDKIIRSFFKKNALLINKVFKTRESLSDLHYSIVLKEDNLNNRTKLFSFLENFDLMDVTQKHPIYFQFIPQNLVDKIHFQEEIKIG